MGTLYVAEYKSVGYEHGGAVPIGRGLLAEQTVAIGGSSVAVTNAFNKDTKFLRVNVDAACSIAIGEATIATATTGKMRLAANQTEFFSANPGDKIAVISNP